MTYTLDKTGWPDGPWMQEPDSAFWVDEATELPCVILRMPQIGHLCGYVGVPPDHTVYGEDYETVCIRVDVHGGITFGGPTLAVVDPTQEEVYKYYYWYGFDCGHAWDICPGMHRYLAGIRTTDVYRDFDYVRAEVTSLAKQLYSFLAPLELLARAADDGLRRPAEAKD
jgi:hypothetical protein